MTIGQRAAKAIKERVHYRKVAPELERLGIDRTNFRRWMDGNGDPQAYWLQQMALAGYDVYWILTGEHRFPVQEIDYDIAEFEEEL